MVVIHHDSGRDRGGSGGYVSVLQRATHREGVKPVAKTVYRPGQIVPVSGQYAVVTASGQYAGREVTCVKGEPFPPTRPGTREYGYVLVDATVHRR